MISQTKKLFCFILLIALLSVEAATTTTTTAAAATTVCAVCKVQYCTILQNINDVFLLSSFVVFVLYKNDAGWNNSNDIRSDLF